MTKKEIKEIDLLFTEQPWTAIRKLEQASEWKLAAEYSLRAGYKDNARYCQLLADAISFGDKYRARVKYIMDWIDATAAAGHMTREKCIANTYGSMQAIYEQCIKEEKDANKSS